MPSSNWLGARLPSDRGAGHYESWYLRANDPTRRRALWLRYTLLRPAGAPAHAIGERWAVWFDGEQGRVVAVREPVPWEQVVASAAGLDVRLGDATLTPHQAIGHARDQAHLVAWQLAISGEANGFSLLSSPLLRARWPRAKAVTPMPDLRLTGTVTVDGVPQRIDGWRGALGHNWGARHTDAYGWVQVIGFDDAPTVQFEAAVARIRVGRWWTPRLAPMVVRIGARTLALTGLAQAARATAGCDGARWWLRAEAGDLRVDAEVHAVPAEQARLTYVNPPGGTTPCVNSKLASCVLTVRERGSAPRTYHSRHGAALELLGDVSRLG